MSAKSEEELSKGFGIRARRVFAYIVLAIITFLCLIWFYILIVNSTRSKDDLTRGFTVIPGKFLWKNWVKLLHGTQPVLQGMRNSLIVSTCTAALCTYFSTLTAYAVHAYYFRGRKAVVTFILAVMMIPTQVTALGFIEFMKKMGMDNSFLPLIIPAIAVQAIFSFVSSWNNYFTPALLLREKKKTLPILLAELRGADFLKFDMGTVYVMIAFSILPVVIVYLVLSKNIVGGIALGGVKG